MSSRTGTVSRTLSLVLALALSIPSAAFAAAPQEQPIEVLREGFEPGTTPGYTLLDFPGATAQWGPTTLRKSAGLQGLWCAGSTLPGGPSLAYPVDTTAWVQFNLPMLADFYSATLDFKYYMPSLGTGDAQSFGVRWNHAITPNDQDEVFGWVKTSSWRSEQLDLASGDYPLVRHPSQLSFTFMDLTDGMAPHEGEGATIDDVVITGWKYGPVRNAAATLNEGTVHLSWSRPHRSVVDSTLEDRSIVYRVYRAPVGSASWTEVASSPAASGSTNVTLDDTLPAEGFSFDYMIQAADTGNGPGYGQPSPRLTVALPLGSSSLTVSQSKTIVGYGGSASITGTLTASGDPGAGKTVYLREKSTSAGSWVTKQTGLASDSGAVAFTVKPVNKTWYRLYFSTPGYEVAETSASEIAVTPGLYLSKPWKPTTAYRNKAFTSYGILRPRHTSGTSPVRIYRYRYVSGQWKVYGSYVSAKVVNYSSGATAGSKYSAKITLPYAGKWRLRALAPADTKHATTEIYTTSFTVK